ncbi:hypothetical protein ABH935_007040 [Catenulispora sp. GAS73]|uniref:hypothetical protein n=1 Tax=Catenulispora sp. GAS73 TaxID=3156269 RepID=UPI003513CF4A
MSTSNQVTTIRYDVLPGMSLDVTYRNATGAFYCATLWETATFRREYTTESGMRRGVARALDRIASEEAAGGSGYYYGSKVPYTEHPVYGANWQTWQPQDGPRWHAEDTAWNNKKTTTEHRAALAARREADPAHNAERVRLLADVADAKTRWFHAPDPAAQHQVKLELFRLIAEAAMAGVSLDELQTATGWDRPHVIALASFGGVEFKNGQARRTVKG